MTILGPLAKGLAFLIGKQPEEERHPRGFLGLEWSAGDGEDRPGGSGPRPAGLRVRRVLEGSPAARAGLRPGDEIVRIGSRPVADAAAARAALASLRPGEEVELAIRRPDDKEREKPGRERPITITAGEGL
jgi:S1-C subfamily serine protease